MGNVFIHLVMSLDGFIDKPDDDLSWMFQYGSDEMAGQMMKEVGAVIVGNRRFREGTMTQDTVPYGGMKVPQSVVTHHAREPLEISGLTFTFVTEGIEHAVALAREAAGDKRVALLGASIDQQCLQAGLVDEIVIHLVPLVLGDGLRFIDHLDSQVELKREELVSTGQITSLRFSVVKEEERMGKSLQKE